MGQATYLKKLLLLQQNLNISAVVCFISFYQNPYKMLQITKLAYERKLYSVHVNK